MIAIGLYSEDRTLQPLLSSALGRDFKILLESDEDGMNRLASSESPNAAIDATTIDVMILDLNSALDSGHDSLKQRILCAQRLIDTHVPAIVMADDSLRSTAFELVRSGAFAYCRRPPSIRDLKTLLQRACETTTLKRQLKPARHPAVKPGCDQIIGNSPRIERVYQLVHSVANLNAAVLVTGESGTGKELIARAIHNIGSRAGKPFVAVSCGAIPETLIEAELFGHEKGAFTGTVGAREGYFEQAADGTLFLDEIGDLSLFTQVKLLRVLQQMEFNRLGSTTLVPLRARIVFATHQDLAKLVAEGKFRQDLYYRINVMRIEAPALEDRPEDIGLIARHFLAKYSEAFQKPMEDIEPDALEIMQSYSWPGNVRELENVVQRAIILAPGRTVRAQDLNLNIQDEESIPGSSSGVPGSIPGSVVDIADYQPAGSFERMLNDYKVKLAVNAVRENNGNKTLAARSLCISRAYLHRLIRNVEPEPAFEPAILRQTASA